MLRLRSILFDVAMYGLLAVIGIVMAPLALWSMDGAYRGIKIYCRTVLWVLEKLCGLRCETRGTIPTGAVIVASKHQSFLDILILARDLPRPKFIMKKELRWAPVLGLYAWRMGSTPVDRGAGGRAMKDMVAHVGQSGDAGQLVIYPQGTRVLPGAVMPYRIGAGVLYSRLERVCIPAATNVGVFWSRRSPYRRPGLAVIEVLDPIPPGLPLAEFMARIEEVVETASDRLMREAGFDPAQGVISDGRAREAEPRRS